MAKPILSRIFQVLFFLSFIFVYIGVIFTNSGNKPWLSVLIGIFFLAAGIGVAFFCNKIAVKWKPKVNHLIFCGIALVILILLIYSAFSLQAVYTWDINIVYTSAISQLNGGYFNHQYLAAFPNNIFLYLVIKLFYIIIFALTGSTSVIYLMLLNAMLIFITVIFIYLIATKLWGSHIGLLVGIICLFFVPFYTFTAYYYTDTFAIPFVVIPIYLYLCAIDCKKPILKYSLFAGAGILLALGFKMKATVAIILVAILIHFLLNSKMIPALKGMAAILASFIIIFFSYNIAVNQFHIVSPEESQAEQIPYTHWIMMGLKGYGGYNEEDYNVASTFPSIEEKKEANIKEIKNRLSNMGFTGLLKHLENKAVHNTWGDGAYHIFEEGNNKPQTDSKLWQFVLKDGKYYNYFYYYSQGFHLAVLTLFMLSLGIGIKNGKVNVTLLFKIALFGIFLFLLIWETRSRYLFIFTPLLLLISADTCSQISNINFHKLKDKLPFKKKKQPIDEETLISD